MRRIVTAITAVSLAFSLVATATPADAAVPGYDSAYAGESAFLTLSQGQDGTFTVFFANTGATAWTRGTSTQVDLATCLEDKVTCNVQDASEAPFNNGWLSASRYTTHTQTTVAPGQIGTFTYNVRVPAAAAPGTYRFNGALVLSVTGADIHNEGYYQDVTVPTVASAATLTIAPAFQFNQVGQNATLTVTTRDSASALVTNVAFTCNIADNPLVGGTTTFNPPLTITGTTGSAGTGTVSYTRANPGTDTVTCYVTANPIARASATAQFGLISQALSVGPDTAATQATGTCRTYTVTFLDPSTGTGVVGQSIAIAFVETTGTGGVVATPNPVITGAGGTATFTLCGSAAATATPRGTTTYLGNAYADNGGTTTFQAPVGTTATLTPASATNAPSSTTASAAVADGSSGEETYTFTVTDQFGVAIAATGSTVFTVTASGGTVNILGCTGVTGTTAVAAGASATCTTPAGSTTQAITIDSAAPGASATITASFTPTGGTAMAMQTATKTYLSTVLTYTAPSGPVSGTVTFADKRTCDGTAAAPAGYYVLQVGTTNYLIAFHAPHTYAVVGSAGTCGEFRAALSSGDVIVYAPTGTTTHNMTTNAP